MAEDQEPLSYTPMADAYAEPPKEEKEFTSDVHGIESAAKELEETRAESEPIERKYIQLSGPDAGKDVPPDQSIDLKRAINDIQRQRDWEKTVAEHEGAQALAESVDNYRAEKAAELQAAQQQAQPEPQPQTSPEQALPPGADPEIAEVLIKNPRLRAAVEAEVIKADAARQQYANATQAAAQVAVASVLAQYPEIQGLSAEQLPTALQVMAAQNPQRAAEVASHLQRAEQIYRLHEQARGQNAAIMQAQIQHWAQQQDAAMDQHLASEPVEVVRSVKDNLAKVMSETYGISRDELAQAFATTPILRAAPFQRALYDLVKHHMSHAQISDKKYRAAPPVMRPGTRSDRQESADDAQIARAHKAFLANPNPKNASAFILAKRNAGR